MSCRSNKQILEYLIEVHSDKKTVIECIERKELLRFFLPQSCVLTQCIL